MLRIVLINYLLIFSVALQAESLRVRAEGLFKDGAVLNIDGKRRLLKAGQTSPEGVRLLSAGPKQAHIEMNGKRHSLSLSKTISSDFSAPAKRQVLVNKSRHNAYYTSGTINGQTVKLLIDTGATSVAMNSKVAKRLGIDYLLHGKKGSVRTASGVTSAYYIKLNSVAVGGITVNNVAASVIEGDFPHEILLGMSYLSHVKMEEQQGVLSLQQKY
ncbi:MAG: retropepsin-like aspartic protease family protein [Pseudomonadales bacterium]